MATAAFVGGGNPSGANAPGLGDSSGAIGSVPNPLIPGFPSGANGMAITNPVARMKDIGYIGPEPTNIAGSTMPGPISGYTQGGNSGGPPTSATTPGFPANTGGTSPTNIAGLSPAGGASTAALISGFQAAGFPEGVAQAIAAFLNGGAGFNPQIAQALINAMQPQVARGTAQIQEQFGAEGLGSSSPAAIGMGDFLSQVNLNEQEVFANMYETAVGNYMNTLLSGKKTPLPSGLGALIGGAGSLAGGLAGLLKTLGVGSGGGGNSGGGGGNVDLSGIPTGGAIPSDPSSLPPVIFGDPSGTGLF